MHSLRLPPLLAGSLLFTIAPQLFAQTTVVLTTSANPSTLGAPVILRAAVTPTNATGRVTFYDGVTFLGTAPVVSGAASLSTVLLPAGNRKLKAYYAGDSSNSAAASNVVTQTVKAQPSSGSFKAGQFISVFDAAVVADFNGDGKADVACPLTDVGIPVVFVGNGDGTFNSISYNSGSSAVTDVLVPVGVGDFNGDGKADLAVRGASSHKVSILLGNGDGTLQSDVWRKCKCLDIEEAADPLSKPRPVCSRYLTTWRCPMNAFVEHHKESIQFGYRCFDRFCSTD